MDIVLTVDNHKMVLTKPCPMDSITESNPTDKEAFASRLRSEVFVNFQFACASNVLFMKHTYKTSTSDIFFLTEMFSCQTRKAK